MHISDIPQIASLNYTLFANYIYDYIYSFHKQNDDSEDECSQRALSDQWHFRRKNRKWSRRAAKKSSSMDFLNYSSEDLLSDPETPTATSSSLMLVSELRNSLTGLDRAVKTYSFLPTDDQIPKIMVDSPEGSPTAIVTSSQESGGDSNGSEPKTGDIFQDNSAEKGYSWEDDGDFDSLGSMAGILDEFDSNLLKWKTQSLPDIFGAAKHLDGSDVSSETSLLSSASASTNSIAEGRRGEERTSVPPNVAGGSASDDNILSVSVSDATHVVNGGAVNDGIVRQNGPLKQASDQKRDWHQRFDSIGSTGTFESQSSSLAGSENDRDRGGISASPLPAYPERYYMQNELGMGSVSPVKLRTKRSSTSSDQQLW